MSTAKVISIVHPTGSITNLVNDANGGITIGGTLTANSSANITGNVAVTGFANVGGTVIMASSFKRNRIINGNMLIDQRNAGANVTPASGAYTLDRWGALVSQSSKFSVQQNAASVTPPAGFKNYLGVTSLSSYSITSADNFSIYQIIEGYNVADLGWGASGAQTVTLSFWVRSSLTGTFGSVISNQYTASGRYYPFTYTISAANTWEQKTITITGDVTGTWGSTSGNGIVVIFGLGTGSTYSGTAGAWSGTYYLGATGATSVVGTSGATFYVTGVQLEVGTKATPYEFVTYSEQLAQCQRYYYNTAATATYSVYTASASAGLYSIYPPINHFVPMRATPVIVLTKGGGGGSPDCSLTAYPAIGSTRFVSGTTGNATDYVWTASAEL